MKAKLYKVGFIIKFDLLNMSFNVAPVSLVEEDGPDSRYPPFLQDVLGSAKFDLNLV